MMPRFTLSLVNLYALPDIHVRTPTGQHFDKHFPLIQHKIIAFYHKLAQRQVIIPYHHSSRVHVCPRNCNANNNNDTDSQRPYMTEANGQTSLRQLKKENY